MASVQIQLAPTQARTSIEAMLTTYLAELGADPAYPFLDLYWSEPLERFPYLITHQSKPVGFALVRWSGRFEMAEFFVHPRARRLGVGGSAVRLLLSQHSGPWFVSVFPGSAQALSFWKAALSRRRQPG